MTWMTRYVAIDSGNPKKTGWMPNGPPSSVQPIDTTRPTHIEAMVPRPDTRVKYSATMAGNSRPETSIAVPVTPTDIAALLIEAKVFFRYRLAARYWNGTDLDVDVTCVHGPAGWDIDGEDDAVRAVRGAVVDGDSPVA